MVAVATGPITTLQPVIAAATPLAVTSELQATMLLYDRLIHVDERLEPQPRLGRWDVSADGRTYRWTIHANARWTDGAPVVAEDYATAVSAIARSRKTSRLVAAFREIEGFAEFQGGSAARVDGITLDAADPKQMTVRLRSSLCSSLAALFGGPFLIPSHVFGKYLVPGAGDAIDRAPENDDPRVTSGPFRFGDWRRGDQLRLIRNEGYFRGASYLDEYVFRHGGAIADELRKGTANFGSPAEPVEIPGVVTTVSMPSSSYVYVGWNTQSATAPALRDKRVRQAFAHAFDWDAVNAQLFGGTGLRMTSHHLPGSWALPPGLRTYGYDLARAEDLLRSAGYARRADGVMASGGQVLAITLTTDEETVRKAVLQHAATQLATLGVQVRSRIMKFDEWQAAMRAADASMDAWVFGISLSEEPDPFHPWHSAAQRDPERAAVLLPLSLEGLDRAIDAGRSGPDCSVAKRKEAYAAFNRILNEEQPFAFGITRTKYVAMPAGMRGFVPPVQAGLLGLFNNVNEWWIAK